MGNKTTFGFVNHAHFKRLATMAAHRVPAQMEGKGSLVLFESTIYQASALPPPPLPQTPYCTRQLYAAPTAPYPVCVKITLSQLLVSSHCESCVGQ